jgi:CDP-diglyceride synthetase
MKEKSKWIRQGFFGLFIIISGLYLERLFTLKENFCNCTPQNPLYLISAGSFILTYFCFFIWILNYTYKEHELNWLYLINWIFIIFLPVGLYGFFWNLTAILRDVKPKEVYWIFLPAFLLFFILNSLFKNERTN